MTPADLTAARAALARVRERHAAATPGPWTLGLTMFRQHKAKADRDVQVQADRDFYFAARTSEPLLAAVAEAALGLVEMGGLPVRHTGRGRVDCDEAEWRELMARTGRVRDALAALGGAP